MGCTGVAWDITDILLLEPSTVILLFPAEECRGMAKHGEAWRSMAKNRPVLNELLIVKSFGNA